MTESHTGPPMDAGSGGQRGDMPGTGSGGGATGIGGSGSESASSSSGTGSQGVATARRTSATQAGVPQQLGYQQERMAGETEMEEQAFISEPVTLAAKQTWWVVLLCGLGMIALGIALLVWPSASLTVVAILIGAAVMVSGLSRLYEGFTAKAESGGMRAAYVVIGFLAVLAGLYLLRHHALSLFLVAFVTGVYFIAHGISDLGVAISGATPNRGLRAVLGVVSLAAGIVMVIWPSITLVLLLTIVAAWLLFYGLVLGALAFGLRRAAKAVRPAKASSQRMAVSTQ